MFHVLSGKEASSKFPLYSPDLDVVVEFYGSSSDSAFNYEVEQVKAAFSKHYTVSDVNNNSTVGDCLSWIRFTLKKL